jgi:hypothetical protein
MNSAEAVCQVLDAAEKAGVPYMLTGSLASGVWGIPRASKDADIVFEMAGLDPGKITQHLGPAFLLEDQMSFESITGSYRWILRVPEISFVIELFLLSGDDHHRARFSRRVQQMHPTLMRPAFIPTAEDVIIQKIRWGRDKDKSDAMDVMSVQGPALDWPYIESWCDRHGTRVLLDQLRASIPPDLLNS